MNSSRRSKSGVNIPVTACSTLAAALSVCSGAQAQQSGNLVLEEVTVTARRKVEDIADVPTSLTVFSAAELERGGIADVADYFLKTPNVSLQEGATRGQNSISIRGISDIGGGGNSSFALYVDELNVIRLTSNPQLQDVARIEVLRGPQGTFFGRNAAGGAINISTNRPGPQFEAKAFAGAASFDTYEGSATLNVPLSGNFFLRGTGYYYTTDGAIENVNPAGGADDQRNKNGRLQARFVPTEDLTLDLSVSRTEEHSGMETGVHTGVLLPGTIALIGPNPILNGLPTFPQNTDKVNYNDPLSTDQDFTIYNGRVTYANDAFSITSITGVGDARRLQSGDIDQSGIDATELTRLEENDMLSQELRVASVGEGRFRWTVGVLYADEDSDSDLSVFLGTQNPLGAPPGTVIRRTMSSGETKSAAGFGEIDWHVTDRVTLTYGGRYSTDEVSAATTIRSFSPAGPVVQAQPQKSEDFSNYSSKVAARYDITPQTSVYALASQGYRAGGVQLDPALPRDSFDPETLWNYEVGLKGQVLGDRLRFAASVFRIDWQDMQVRTRINGFDPNTGAFLLVTGVDNAAEASSTGAELELRTRLGDLELGATAGWLDAKFEDYRAAVIDGARVVNGAPVPVDLSGHRLLDAPEWSLSADAQYDFPIGSWEGFLRAEWSYRDSVIANPVAYLAPGDLRFPVDYSFPYQVPAFDVWNFRAGVSRDRWQVLAYVENAFDENYYTGAFDDLYFSGGSVRVHPRVVGLRVSYDF